MSANSLKTVQAAEEQDLSKISELNQQNANLQTQTNDLSVSRAAMQL